MFKKTCDFWTSSSFSSALFKKSCPWKQIHLKLFVSSLGRDTLDVEYFDTHTMIPICTSPWSQTSMQKMAHQKPQQKRAQMDCDIPGRLCRIMPHHAASMPCYAHQITKNPGVGGSNPKVAKAAKTCLKSQCHVLNIAGVSVTIWCIRCILF